MSKLKRELELIVETSVRNFQSRMINLSNRGFYLIGSLVITKTIDTWIPFRLINEYAALMQKVETIEEKEKES
jgi:hypothetical protein